VTPLHDRDDQLDVPPPQGLSLLLHLPDGEMRSAIEELFAPWNNRITVARSLAEASILSARGGFSAAIVTAPAADALAAVPGQSTPLLAIATSHERRPDGAAYALRWPAGASALYGAIHALTGETGVGAEVEEDAEPAIDAKAFAELEKSLGFKTLVDILQSYLKTAEDLATALAAASEGEDWKEAGRVAQDFAGAAGGLGLTALTAAARALAQGARDGAAKQKLLAASGEVLSEHRRVDTALRRLYPDLSA
jgi:HPt (histidine-containing phosphotransfer) domain-containing protein